MVEVRDAYDADTQIAEDVQQAHGIRPAGHGRNNAGRPCRRWGKHLMARNRGSDDVQHIPILALI
jgi:hypothetical protein